MENVRETVYSKLLESFGDTLGDKSVTAVQGVVQQIGMYADHLYDKDTSVGQSKEALEAIPAMLAKGLQSIISNCHLAQPSSTSNFEWLAENYGKVISFGAKGRALGFSYESRTDSPRSISVKMVARTGRYSEFVAAYAHAFEKGEIRAPGNVTMDISPAELDEDGKPKDGGTIEMRIDAREIL
jgi:hypothetical protein